MEPEFVLRRGQSAASVAASLRTLVAQGRNSDASGSSAFIGQLKAYTAWVESAEVQLRRTFASPTIWEDLYTDRFWRLSDLDAKLPRPIPLLGNEIDAQCVRLDGVAERLEAEHALLQPPDDCALVVADTNVFAHYQPFPDLPWTKLVKAKQVRLLVPLVILDELDTLSYRPTGGGGGAKQALRTIRKLWSAKPDLSPAEVGKGLSLQLLTDPPGHVRRGNADDEILTRIEAVSGVVNQSIALATGDLGMQVRAAARGIPVLLLDDALRAATNT